MLIGNLKLKDKRIDKILKAKGLLTSDIYYSPLTFMFIIILLFLQAGLISLFFILIPEVYLLIATYFIFCYLMNAFYNNSFAVCKDKLVVINPNIPFRHVTIFERKDVKKITIDTETNILRQLFMDFGGNYLLIETDKGELRYNCSYLNVFDWDDNITEKTLDDMHRKLLENNFNSVLKIDY